MEVWNASGREELKKNEELRKVEALNPLMSVCRAYESRNSEMRAAGL